MFLGHFLALGTKAVGVQKSESWEFVLYVSPFFCYDEEMKAGWISKVTKGRTGHGTD